MSETRIFELADNGARVMAFIIDSMIIGAIGSIFGAGGGWALGGIASFLILLGYQWFFLIRNDGQTPGKMLMKIRVIKTDGTPISDVDVVMRALGYTINSLPVIGWLGWAWAFWDPNQQGWHDKLARTYVVKAEENEDRGTVIVGKRKVEDYE